MWDPKRGLYHKGVIVPREAKAEPKKTVKKKVEEKDEKKIEKKVTKEKKIISEAEEKKLLLEAEKREEEAKEKAKEEKEKEKKVAKTKQKAEKEEKEIKKAPIRKRGKNYKNAILLIDKMKKYPILEAISLAKKTGKTKFDSTVDMVVRIDKKIENLRGIIHFPSGMIKEKKVLIVDEKSVDDIISKIKSGKIEFDVMVATPGVMPKLATVAKILGPKGLMPNPKTGTVAENTKEAAEEFKSGKIEYKADKGNNIHLSVGKLSFSDEKIAENIKVVIASLPKNKIVSASLSTTMGPSVKIEL